MTFLKAFFGGSKKATSVVAGLLLVIFSDALGLDQETAQALVTLIMTYIAGQGAVDVALAFKGAKKS